MVGIIKYFCFALLGSLVLAGCSSTTTFPKIARAGDTVSFMVGGSAETRKQNVTVQLTDASNQVFDLQAMGLVRSVFNLRPEGRAVGMHYSNYLESDVSWLFEHEPLQTVMVTDLPVNVATGPATLAVGLVGVNDNSSGTGNGPFTTRLEIIPNAGRPDPIKYFAASGAHVPVDFSRLETAPNAKISFDSGGTAIGAATLVLDFNENIVNSNDINLYVPESTVRGNGATPGAFGMTQRMVYWHQDGQNLYVDIIAPQGINPRYLQFYVVHPPGLTGSPAFNIVSAHVFGTDGNPIDVTPILTYSP